MTELKDSFAGGAAWRKDLEQPGTPMAPATGAGSPTALGKALPVQRMGLGSVCGYLTTSFLAYEVEFAENLLFHGPALPGCPAPSTSQPHPVLTPCEQSELVRAALNGPPGAPPPRLTSVQVQILSSSPQRVTMTVTGYGVGGSLGYTLTAWKIGGRWFATSFGSGSAQPTAQPTAPSTSPTTVPSAPSTTMPPSPPATAAATPDLFVSNAMTDALYSWPEFPTTIFMDDNDWIAKIAWSAGPRSASGSGTLYTDLSCGAPAASCPPTAEGTVELSATSPETCTVTVMDPQTGARESEQAYVYDRLRYQEITGPQPGKIVTFSPACT